MKKVLLTGLIVSALSSTAFAAAPVTNFQAGESAVQLHYTFGEHNDLKSNDGDEIDAVKGKHNFGFALSTALNDKWALQYSYNPLLNSDKYAVEPDNDNEPVAGNAAAGGAAAAQPAPAVQPAAAQPAAPAAKKAEKTFAFAQTKVKLHQLQGIYKANENLNLYVGIDHLRTTYDEYGVKENKEKQLVKYSESDSESRTGVSAGVIGHTKLGEKTTAFAQLGVGSVVRYEAKFGVSHDLTKDLSLVASYNLGKYRVLSDDGDNLDLKHRGVNLAVNYKF